MSQRIADASAKVARSFYPLPRITDNVISASCSPDPALEKVEQQAVDDFRLLLLGQMSALRDRMGAESRLSDACPVGSGLLCSRQTVRHAAGVGGDGGRRRRPYPRHWRGNRPSHRARRPAADRPSHRSRTPRPRSRAGCSTSPRRNERSSRPAISASGRSGTR